MTISVSSMLTPKSSTSEVMFYNMTWPTSSASTWDHSGLQAWPPMHSTFTSHLWEASCLCEKSHTQLEQRSGAREWFAKGPHFWGEILWRFSPGTALYNADASFQAGGDLCTQFLITRLARWRQVLWTEHHVLSLHSDAWGSEAECSKKVLLARSFRPKGVALLSWRHKGLWLRTEAIEQIVMCLSIHNLLRRKPSPNSHGQYLCIVALDCNAWLWVLARQAPQPAPLLPVLPEPVVLRAQM